MGRNSCRSALRKLFKKKKGLCCYCGCKTKLPKFDLPGSGLHDNSASIEHLYSRYDIRRYAQKTDRQFIDLSCRKCNIERSNRETLLLHGANFMKGLKLDIRLPFGYWSFPMEEYIFPNFNL